MTIEVKPVVETDIVDQKQALLNAKAQVPAVPLALGETDAVASVAPAVEGMTVFHVVDGMRYTESGLQFIPRFKAEGCIGFRCGGRHLMCTRENLAFCRVSLDRSVAACEEGRGMDRCLRIIRRSTGVILEQSTLPYLTSKISIRIIITDLQQPQAATTLL